MSDLVYTARSGDRPIVWLHGEVRTPPFTDRARVEVGYLLRLLQRGVRLSLPHSRPMPAVGPRCHELRVNDEDATWRIVYRLEHDAVVVADVFEKKTTRTPQHVIDASRRRLAAYDREG